MTDQCDWPETVDCAATKTLAKFKARARGKPTTLFLTFDDGPNEGTEQVLNALRKENVRATFFINSKSLHDPNPQVKKVECASILTRRKVGRLFEPELAGIHPYFDTMT